MADTLPDIPISFSSNGSVNMRVLEAQFGDGYNQRAADGLNSISTDWSLVWTARPDADITILTDFFRSKFGFEIFLFTPPNDIERQYVCKDYKPTPTADGFSSLTAKLEEQFDI